MLPFNSHPLHSTKDIRGHPLFRGAISRWLWRLATQRLTRPGRWFAGMTVAFALYGATSLDLQVFVPFTYAVSVWLLALVWTWVRPPRVSLAVRQPARAKVGEALPVSVEVQAQGRAVFDAVLLPSRLPPAVDAADGDGVSLGALLPGERHTVRVDLRPTRRGLFHLPGFRVQTDFPFGLLRAFTVIPAPQTLLVRPQWAPLRGLNLPVRRSDQPGGAALATARGEAMEFIGNREFREGDNIRDMDWRASARLDRLVVREFHEEYLHRIAIVLDTFVPDAEAREAEWEGAVSLCAAAGEWLARQEYSLSLLLAGPDLHVFDNLSPLAAQEHMLDVLAVVVPGPRPPLPEAISGLAEQLEGVSVAVCVLLGWDEARRAFVEGLHQIGVSLFLVLVADKSTQQDVDTDLMRFGPIQRVTLAQLDHGVEHL